MFSIPEKNIAKLGLREGMKVADFGAGIGAYSLASSKFVGNTGRVYAIEVQKNLVKKFENEIKEQKIFNVECIWGDIEKHFGTKLADHSVDRIIITNVLFLSEDKIGLIDEARRILKKDGQVLLVDWISFDKDKSKFKKYEIEEKVAEDIFIKRGFKVLEKINLNPHHYGIIFEY